MTAKETKLRLMELSAELGMNVMSRLAAVLPLDPAIKDPNLQSANILEIQLLTVFYPWLLAAHTSNGKNPDGSTNAFVDPPADGAGGAAAGLDPTALAAQVTAMVAKALGITLPGGTPAPAAGGTLPPAPGAPAAGS